MEVNEPEQNQALQSMPGNKYNPVSRCSVDIDCKSTTTIYKKIVTVLKMFELHVV